MATTFHVPSRSFAGSHSVRFDERTGQWFCSCAGFTYWHTRKDNFTCYHIRTIQNRIADSLLIIEGSPTSCMLESMVSDVQEIFLSQTHWIYDHHRRARYGYVPRYGPDWKARIGLKAEARREWLQVETSAAIAVLRRMVETLEVKQVA